MQEKAPRVTKPKVKVDPVLADYLTAGTGSSRADVASDVAQEAP